MKAFRILLTTAVSILFFLSGCSSNPQSADPETYTVIRIEDSPGLFKLIRNPDRGYNYDAYIRIPDNYSLNDPGRLLVIPNNSGSTSDTLKFQDERARTSIEKSWEGRIASGVRAPLLMPVFPRPQRDWQYYTHSLDADTLKIKNGKMARLDMQLIAMINDSMEYINEITGISLEREILMSGVSASSTFSNRFAAIHPEIVRAVACGAINSIPFLPLSEYKGHELPYHTGIADLGEITGKEFNREAWEKVSQYIYMGDQDDNDTTLYDDGYTRSEASLVWETVGKDMAERWTNCINIYLNNSPSVQMVTYIGMGHSAATEDLVEFLKVNSGSGFTPIEPSLPAKVFTGDTSF